MKKKIYDIKGKIKEKQIEDAMKKNRTATNDEINLEIEKEY